MARLSLHLWSTAVALHTAMRTVRYPGAAAASDLIAPAPYFQGHG